MIDFIDVEKTYKSGVEALKGVSFTIEDGEFVFIIGKSGSGKSTLLKCITCEETPTSGKVTIDNFDISHMSRALVPVLRRKIGMIYQDFRCCIRRRDHRCSQAESHEYSPDLPLGSRTQR